MYPLLLIKVLKSQYLLCTQLSDVKSQLATKTKELSDMEKRHKKEASNATQEHEEAKKAYDAHVSTPDVLF